MNSLLIVMGIALSNPALTPLAPPHRLEEVLPLKNLKREQISLLIEKSRYRLTLKYKGKPVKTYSVVFGCSPIGDKRYEGDCRTPEGVFHILERRKHAKWTYFLLLDYPNAISWRRFYERKRRGELPDKSTVGSAIGIHGVPVGYDKAVDTKSNWTLGCISLKTEDIREIYRVTQKGTRVGIVR